MNTRNIRIHVSSNLDILICLGNDLSTQNSLLILLDLASFMVLLKVQNLHPRTEIHMRGCILNGCHWGQEHGDFRGAPSLNIIDIGDFCTSVGQHMIKYVPILRPNAEIVENQGPTHMSRIPRQSPRRNATNKT